MALAIVRNPADLIARGLHDRVVAQLIREHAGMTGDEAVRIVDATIAFLTICAENPDQQFRPSKRVDLGWHMFILNTRDYAAFCTRVPGFSTTCPTSSSARRPRGPTCVWRWRLRWRRWSLPGSRWTWSCGRRVRVTVRSAMPGALIAARVGATAVSVGRARDVDDDPS